MEEQHYQFNTMQRDEIKGIVQEALTDYFATKGKIGKNLIIGTAVIIGSLTVIFGGLKAILGWIGFTYIGK